jgi:hypothetical protein
LALFLLELGTLLSGVRRLLLCRRSPLGARRLPRLLSADRLLSAAPRRLLSAECALLAPEHPLLSPRRRQLLAGFLGKLSVQVLFGLLRDRGLLFGHRVLLALLASLRLLSELLPTARLLFDLLSDQ